MRQGIEYIFPLNRTDDLLSFFYGDKSQQISRHCHFNAGFQVTPPPRHVCRLQFLLDSFRWVTAANPNTEPVPSGLKGPEFEPPASANTPYYVCSHAYSTVCKKCAKEDIKHLLYFTADICIRGPGGRVSEHDSRSFKFYLPPPLTHLINPPVSYTLVESSLRYKYAV